MIYSPVLHILLTAGAKTDKLIQDTEKEKLSAIHRNIKGDQKWL